MNGYSEDEERTEQVDSGMPEAEEHSAGRPRRSMRSTKADMGPVIAAAVVRISSAVRPETRPGEGWPRDRAGVALQMVSAPARSHGGRHESHRQGAA